MKSRLLHTPDGVRDLYNGEYKRKLLIQEQLHDVFMSYGCFDIQTPTFEYFDVFSNQVGTTPSKDLFKFFDKEGNTVKNYSESKADPVMVLTYDTWLNSENDSVATYTTICGTTDFADKEYLTDVSYGNRDVLFLAMRLMGKEVVPFEIDFKVVQSEGLEMDETEVIVWEICLIGIIPVTALVLGTVVFIKRRHM